MQAAGNWQDKDERSLWMKMELSEMVEDAETP